ncbi:MAG: hypothetical protein IT332_08095 [Ardenticatenales bacterium]|nr:hypothetical protein [Ardenticatenales bacterium]
MPHVPRHVLAAPPLAAASALAALALALAGTRTSHADRPPSSHPARPAQVATPTPDPRPNLVAVGGQWKLKGRNIGMWQRCVTGNGYDQGFHLCVANAGNAPSGPFVVTADGESSVPVLSTGGLDPAETLCAPVAAAPGVGLFVDAGDAVLESNEDDNWLPPVPVPTLAPVAHPTCVPWPTPLAELAGDGWSGFIDTQGYGCWPTHLPTKALYGARVANVGERAAGPFRVGGPPDWRIADLPADAERTLSDSRFASTHSTEIDADDAVLEFNESNNTLNFLRATAPPTCTPGVTPTPFPAPTLVIERAEYRHLGFDDVCLPEVVAPRVFVRIANTGTGPAARFIVHADDGADPRDVAGLDPGTHVDIEPFDAPVHHVRIVVRDRSFNRVAGDGRRIPQVTLTPPPTCTVYPMVTPSPSPTPTPSGIPGPPDLTATITLNIGRCEGRDGALLGPYHYRPCIVNQGGTEARGFVVRFGEGAAAEDIAVPQLDAGGRLCLAERALVSTVIDVDPDNRIAESDETNNRVPVHIPPELPPPACTPGPAPTATPTPAPLPNLRGWARWWIDLPEGCIPTDRPVPPFYSEVTVYNDGGAAAGAFDTVAEPPGAQRWAFEALPAGASYSRGPSLLTFYRAAIDPDNRVTESDERDNDIYVPVPTMPPYCPTATPTPGDASPTPVRTVTPSLTPSVVPGRRLFMPFAVRTERLAGR